MSIGDFAEEHHWLTIEGFISDTTQQRTYNVEAIIDSDITPEQWAAQAFEDPDTCQWMTSVDRVNQLRQILQSLEETLAGVAEGFQIIQRFQSR